MNGITSVTLLVRSMRRNALGWNGASVVSVSRTCARDGKVKPSVKTPLAAVTAATLRKSRRDDDAGSGTTRSTLLMLGLPCGRLSGGGVGRSDARRRFDRGPDARVGTAAADVALHRGIDVGIGGLWVGRDQCAGGHDLTGLAIAALRHVQRQPGRLDLSARRRAADRLDGRDLLANRGRRRGDA